MSTLAHWCFRRRFAVAGGWIVALVALAAIALGGGTAFTDSADLPDSESATAYALLAESQTGSGSGSGGQAGTDTVRGTVVWHTGGEAVDSAGVKADVAAMLARIKAVPGVEAVVSPYDKAGAAQINTGTGTAYATIVLAADADTAPVKSAALASDTAGFDVEVGGQAFSEQPGASHGTEAVGIIAALVILVLMFRSGWAAALPILTGVVGVAASLLLVMIASHVVDLAATSLTMGALIGLGVGIDYALFIVNRHRRGLLAGRPVRESIADALDTSGRAVVFAGATVIVALLGMFVVNLGILTGMARAAAVTVLFTILAAVTLLPALLAMLGTRVLSRRQRAALATGAAPVAVHRPGLAARWAALVDRAPWRATGAAVLVIAILAAPVTMMRVGDADASSDPAGTPARAYYDLMAPAFGDGFDASLLLVAKVPDPAASTAFTGLAATLATVPGVAAVAPAGRSALTVVPTTSAQTEQTADLVHRLRDEVIPAAEAGTGLRVYVGGAPATSIDMADALMGKLPLYLGLIAVLGFLLLAVAFRSILVPLVGALSNLATILVGLGALTAIFQFGWGSELLGVGSGAPIMYLIPVLIVGVVFGLSMDYQVFLVSRMHEEWTHTRDNRRAIRVGLTETSQVIVAAATIMLCVFASFGFSGERIVSGIGIGLGIAVLVDAFVVRLTLIPALMRLIGRANWAYPRWADRVTPHVSVEGPAREPALSGK
ncbi:putative integral membrane protein [Actinoplanes missouriensis 431]|uniref:Putative integral membrane protein n=1 Tax=Actinoplanes missouriensis (strain ATCC 14538 / DSM 43046 / CBS 188.64 / JCM 3121 / NBRC 102363 / NCIMB 12654 / NRRL B-3342 / UNCC 431) TaxID=512565 RepID=I0H5H7_ACTM4|nr:MMPL family transporter [Actinoplanes missouriensis]BAL88264.1 putative integral membrane protein [Actinoplanes missouriensis 431]